MFNRILVPLGGSPKAEVILPVVAFIAARCQSEVTLLHVVETHSTSIFSKKCQLVDDAEAMIYLRYQAAMIKQTVKRVNLKVINEQSIRVADSIIAVAKTGCGFDLIALCKYRPHVFPNDTKRCIARLVTSQVDIPILLKFPTPNNDNLSYKPFKIALVMDIFTKPDRLIDIAMNLARFCRMQVSLIVLYPEIQPIYYQGRGMGYLFKNNLLFERMNSEFEEKGRLITRRFENVISQQGLSVISKTVPFFSSDQIANILSEESAELVIMGITKQEQPKPVKQFDISRSSHLPLIMVPV